MEERILYLIRTKRFEDAAKIISELIKEKNILETKKIIFRLNVTDLDKTLKKLKKRDREYLLRLILKSNTYIDISNKTKISEATSENTPYLESTPFEIFKKRIPWLLILLVSATFTSLIITRFEARLNLISSLLIACVPMIMDTGGNSGAQSSVTVIRAIALGELSPGDLLKVLSKELSVSLMLGTTLASVCFFKLMFIDRLVFGQPFTRDICFTVSITLFITVVLAKAVGCILPIVAKAMRLDPAVVVSPFITTVIDAVSLTLYCVISIKFLS